MFYNTNKETGETLKESRKKTMTQEQFILKLFAHRPKFGFTSCQLQDLLKTMMKNWPRSSIVRAIANLTKEGKLIKTSDMAMGKYGKKAHIWRLK